MGDVSFEGEVPELGAAIQALNAEMSRLDQMKLGALRNGRYEDAVRIHEGMKRIKVALRALRETAPLNERPYGDV